MHIFETGPFANDERTAIVFETYPAPVVEAASAPKHHLVAIAANEKSHVSEKAIRIKNDRIIIPLYIELDGYKPRVVRAYMVAEATDIAFHLIGPEPF
jgi:hypothetical protein